MTGQRFQAIETLRVAPWECPNTDAPYHSGCDLCAKREDALADLQALAEAAKAYRKLRGRRSGRALDAALARVEGEQA